MSVSKLKSILEVPAEVFNTGNGTMWDVVEKKLGLMLPDDYKEFIDAYGTGGIGNFIWILTPFSKDANINLESKKKVMLEGYLESKSKAPEDFPFSPVTRNVGLMPWGYTENGDELYWFFTGAADKCKIIVYESRSAIYYEYDMSFSEFIVGILAGDISCKAFPDDFLEYGLEYLAIDID